MDNKKTDSYYKSLIINDIEKILEYVKDTDYDEFISDEKLIDAVLFRLIQIVENIKKISDEFKNTHKNIAWAEIVGFRNRIVHDYGKTDYTVVYEIVKDDLKKLLETFK